MGVSVVLEVLPHFEPKYLVKIQKDIWTISSLHVKFSVLNGSTIHKKNETFWFGGIKMFCPKNQAKRIDKIFKDFELYQAFMHNFLC